MKKLRIALGAAGVVAIGITIGGLLGAFGDGDTRDALAAASPPGGAIGVHGQWTIDVLDADGALVARREFHNDLTFDGARYLAAVLGRNQRPGFWSVHLLGEGTYDGPCPAGCWIREPDDPRGGLTSTWSLAIGRSARTLHLAGTAIANVDGSISRVATYSQTCELGSPAPCGYADATKITSTQVSPPVALLEGQQAVVNVDITFSAAP